MRDVTATDQTAQTPDQVLDDALKALAERSYFSRYPESPSPRVYGENAAPQGLSAYEAHLGKPFEGLAGAFDGSSVGDEVSPYGPTLGVAYPHLDVEAAMQAASAAIPADSIA